MTAQWYYSIGGRTQGPVTSDDLRQLARRCEIAATDLVWRDGMADWESAESLGLVTPPVAPPPLPGDALVPGDALAKGSVANSGGSGTVAGPSAADPITSSVAGLMFS